MSGTTGLSSTGVAGFAGLSTLGLGLGASSDGASAPVAVNANANANADTDVDLGMSAPMSAPMTMPQRGETAMPHLPAGLGFHATLRAVAKAPATDRSDGLDPVVQTGPPTVTANTDGQADAGGEPTVRVLVQVQGQHPTDDPLEHCSSAPSTTSPCHIEDGLDPLRDDLPSIWAASVAALPPLPSGPNTTAAPCSSPEGTRACSSDTDVPFFLEGVLAQESPPTTFSDAPVSAPKDFLASSDHASPRPSTRSAFASSISAAPGRVASSTQPDLSRSASLSNASPPIALLPSSSHEPRGPGPLCPGSPPSPEFQAPAMAEALGAGQFAAPSPFASPAPRPSTPRLGAPSAQASTEQGHGRPPEIRSDRPARALASSSTDETNPDSIPDSTPLGPPDAPVPETLAASPAVGTIQRPAAKGRYQRARHLIAAHTVPVLDGQPKTPAKVSAAPLSALPASDAGSLPDRKTPADAAPAPSLDPAPAAVTSEFASEQAASASPSPALHHDRTPPIPSIPAASSARSAPARSSLPSMPSAPSLASLGSTRDQSSADLPKMVASNEAAASPPLSPNGPANEAHSPPSTSLPAGAETSASRSPGFSAPNVPQSPVTAAPHDRAQLESNHRRLDPSLADERPLSDQDPARGLRAPSSTPSPTPSLTDAGTRRVAGQPTDARFDQAANGDAGDARDGGDPGNPARVARVDDREAQEAQEAPSPPAQHTSAKDPDASGAPASDAHRPPVHPDGTDAPPASSPDTTGSPPHRVSAPVRDRDVDATPVTETAETSEFAAAPAAAPAVEPASAVPNAAAAPPPSPQVPPGGAANVDAPVTTRSEAAERGAQVDALRERVLRETERLRPIPEGGASLRFDADDLGELELSIRRDDKGGYAIQLRAADPNSLARLTRDHGALESALEIDGKRVSVELGELRDDPSSGHHADQESGRQPSRQPPSRNDEGDDSRRDSGAHGEPGHGRGSERAPSHESSQRSKSPSASRNDTEVGPQHPDVEETSSTTGVAPRTDALVDMLA